MSTDDPGNDKARRAGQRPEPDNPFAAPSAPRSPQAQPARYPQYDAAPTYDHGTPSDAERHGLPVPGPRPSPAEPVAFPGTEDVAVSWDGPGYTVPEPTNHPLAIAAVVLGVLAVVPGVGVAAVICGHLALRRTAHGYQGGTGLATTGLVLGYTLTVLWALLALALWVQE